MVKLPFTSPSSPYDTLWKKITMCSPHSRSRGLNYTSLWVDIYISILGFSAERFIYSCLLIYICHYGPMIAYFIICYNPILICLFSCSESSRLAMRSSFSWFLHSFNIWLSLWGFCLVDWLVLYLGFLFIYLNTFLFSGITSCERLIMFISCPSLRICHFSK